jgi:hypothetical protein
MGNKLVTVYAGSPIDADLIRSILVADGIDVFLQDEFMGAIISFITPGGSGAVKVLVQESDAERSLYLIRQFEKSRDRTE